MVSDEFTKLLFACERNTNSELHGNIATIEHIHLSSYNQKQAVGGQLPWYAPAQACNGSAKGQPSARLAEPGPISQYALSSRLATHATRRLDVCDRRQTSDRQTSDSIVA